MRHRAFTTVLTAALVYASAPAFAQSAPQPAVSQEEGLQLAHEPGHKRKKRGLLLYILGGVAIAVAVYLLFINDDDDDGPISA
ncbi:MAG TPA: hypothetical protein VF605_01655 [Allosphingosinicella sp.]|jgi:hypothetical protein